MVVYNLQKLQKVDLLEFSQMNPCPLDSLNMKTDEMILRSHQHLAERQLSWKVILQMWNYIAVLRFLENYIEY